MVVDVNGTLTHQKHIQGILTSEELEFGKHHTGFTNTELVSVKAHLIIKVTATRDVAPGVVGDHQSHTWTLQGQTGREHHLYLKIRLQTM